MHQGVLIKGPSKSVSLTTGPRSMKMNRVGTGTSVKSPRTTGCTSRMKAETGFSRQSTSPTSTFEASAPGGIFFKNDVFPCYVAPTPSNANVKARSIRIMEYIRLDAAVVIHHYFVDVAVSVAHVFLARVAQHRSCTGTCSHGSMRGCT